jgi:hypothetical protein
MIFYSTSTQHLKLNIKESLETGDSSINEICYFLNI